MPRPCTARTRHGGQGRFIRAEMPVTTLAGSAQYNEKPSAHHVRATIFGEKDHVR